MAFFERLITPPKGNESYFLLGPRGTGKSTWLKHHYPSAHTINLLEPGTLRNYAARPERLYEIVNQSTQSPIIIDEVQKVTELLPVVHDILEQNSNYQFILTGSSARKLKRSGVNLLAGRALLRHLHPFLASELKERFDLDNAIKYGMLPVIFDSEMLHEKLRAYVDLYLREEVQSEGLVRNIGHFSRFLEIISFSHAQQLNISNIARECQISRKIVESYLSVLEDLLLCFSIPVFTKRAKRKTVVQEKFYLFDSGVFNILRAQGPLDNAHELAGIALEGLVAQHLRAWKAYQGQKNALYYWRTRAGNEVDFIVYDVDTFLAIEVKASEQLSPMDFHGLKAFIEEYPEATPILLHRGKETFKKDNVLCQPVESFLLSLT